MSIVRIREIIKAFLKRKYMRILSGHWKLSVIERCLHRGGSTVPQP